MTPTDRDARDVLAGEYVLGVLDPAEAQEVKTALALDEELRAGVAYWEKALHPLSALAKPQDPPADTWDEIAARLTEPAKPAAPGWSRRAAPWQWSTAGLAALAAALIIYIAVTPPSRPLIAALHGPQVQTADWVATLGRDGLHLAAVGREAPPSARVYELWAIAKGKSRPVPLGVIPASGQFQLAYLPSGMGQGTTLAISIEPPGGSPTGQPTGPVVFVGELKET